VVRRESAGNGDQWNHGGGHGERRIPYPEG
jgi:hypothetical protein